MKRLMRCLRDVGVEICLAGVDKRVPLLNDLRTKRATKPAYIIDILVRWIVAANYQNLDHGSLSFPN